ncbi:hypothetical protein QAD02_023787 [Eretmocerus hayati]|uniref:Uncharacterized protein n=1 Tax=Eretmocerus hayati TaxID=131215 RepID=A0ACC2PX79_9HYME|nr:hypothetical protein QAD02_023787 [Eretmocerus hayati]
MQHEGNTEIETSSKSSSTPSRPFHVTLTLKREPDSSPVFCKVESANKFHQHRTLKLSAEAVYKIDISFNPPQTLEALEIGGRRLQIRERCRDSTVSAYSAHHTTRDSAISIRGQRERLIIAMHVLGSGRLGTALQVKYYPAEDPSTRTGSRLHSIELDAAQVEGRLVVLGSASSDTSAVASASMARRLSRQRRLQTEEEIYDIDVDPSESQQQLKVASGSTSSERHGDEGAVAGRKSSSDGSSIELPL